MSPVSCKITPWLNLPKPAKDEFPHPSAKGSNFFRYNAEWYCIDYLDDCDGEYDYQNDTMKGTVIRCNHVNNSIIVMEEYTHHFVPNLTQLLTLH